MAVHLEMLPILFEAINEEELEKKTRRNNGTDEQYF